MPSPPSVTASRCDGDDVTTAPDAVASERPRNGRPADAAGREVLSGQHGQLLRDVRGPGQEVVADDDRRDAALLGAGTSYCDTAFLNNLAPVGSAASTARTCRRSPYWLRIGGSSLRMSSRQCGHSGE